MDESPGSVGESAGSVGESPASVGAESSASVGAEWPASVGAAAQVFVYDLESLALSDADLHHLDKVLRLRSGELVVSADGNGRWRRSRLVRTRDGANASGVHLEVDGAIVVSDPPRPKVTVGLVATKGSRPDWAVQKLTEVGVDRIAILRSERAVVQWDGERGTRAVERLRRVAREAAAQSRRTYLPDVTGVQSVRELAAELAPVSLGLAHLGGDPPDLAVPAIAVGPEGGWAESELVAAGPLVGLGPTVLRGETAAVAAGVMMCALRNHVVGQVPRRTKE